MNLRSGLKLFSNLLIVSGLMLFILSARDSQNPAKEFESYLKETYSIMVAFGAKDDLFLNDKLSADEYIQAWKTLSERLTAMKEKESKLKLSGDLEKRRLLHLQGISKILEVSGFVSEFVDNKASGSAIPKHRETLLKGLELLKQGEGQESEVTRGKEV